MTSVDSQLADRVAALMEHLAAQPGLVVAYSGGADSAFLLAAAVRALGSDQVLAVTAVSDSLPEVERIGAAEVAAQLGAHHRYVTTHEMDREGYRANAGNRCYFCKAELLDVLTPVGVERGWPVATGTNADDALSPFRPGITAAAERAAITPLRDAGFTKDQVREQSRLWGVPTWDKPAAACLSSRIAYGITITPARLARVEHAEAAVRAQWPTDAALTDLRVRDLGDGRARLEVDQSALDQLTSNSHHLEVVREAVRTSGFGEVSVQAFRSGSMNPPPTQQDPPAA